jgi:acetoin:2,6-dichlorophenolindophenol oxidoreductase subunit alpha
MRQLNIDLYKKVYLIRTAEQAIQKHYREDDMKTPMHMSMGGEAISAGVCHALGRADQVLGSYRTHGIYLARTMETDRFFAEMYGKQTGSAHGKAGSMHLMAHDSGLICTSAIVATQIPVAVGAAFANRQKGNGSVVAVFFGDGAIDEGVFWESLNSACLMRLPVLFVCEDNGYAVHTPAAARHGYRSITAIVRQFACTVFESDSTDVEVIHNLTLEALAAMRHHECPSFLHLKYYRYLEHVGVFDDFAAGYRSREEFDQWYAVDPVRVQREKLRTMMSEDEIRSIEIPIEVQVDESRSRAQAARLPDADVLCEGLFS